MQGFTFDLTNYDYRVDSRPSAYGKDLGEKDDDSSNRTDSEVEASVSVDDATSSYLTGWRLQALNFSLCLGLFLSLLETTIMSTSLLAIIDEFQEQSRSSWVITAYLITYTGFLMPLAKLSDIYGRRPILAFSIITFIAASAGAGWSNGMASLCICRAIQGIGGGGMFGLTFIILPEMVPPELHARYSVIVSSAFALGNLLGPILGGVINDNTTWRWIFWLNIPGGAVALVLSTIALPHHFPYHRFPPDKRPKLSIASLKRIDFLGAILILAANCLLVACLEVGGNQYDWSTRIPITLLVVSISSWTLFILWQYYQHHSANTMREPVIPWRILTDRFIMGTFLNALLFGAAFFAVVINLPLRFQIVDGQSALEAGYRLLPITVVAPFGSVFASFIGQKLKVPSLYMLLAGTSLSIIGLALYTSLCAPERDQRPIMYIFEVLIGLGFGMTLNTTILLIPRICERRDVAVGMGFVGQFRALGGSIGIAGCANLLNKLLTDDLTALIRDGKLTPTQVRTVQEDTRQLESLGEDARYAFVGAYADGFQKEMWLITGFCVVCLIVSGLLWERKPKSVQDMKPRSQH